MRLLPIILLLHSLTPAWSCPPVEAAPMEWGWLLPQLQLQVAWRLAADHDPQWGWSITSLWDLTPLWSQPPSPQALTLCQGAAPGDLAAQVLERLESGEPGIAQTLQAARQHAGLDRLDAWPGRARLSHLAPQQVEVQSTWQRQDDQRLTTRDALDAQKNLEDSQLTDQQQDEEILRLSLHLRWDLRGLIYDPEELTLEKERARQRAALLALEEEVSRVYFERRRLQAQAQLQPPTDWEETAQRRLKLQELTARLDLYTGGWFSRSLVKAGRPPGAPSPPRAP